MKFTNWLALDLATAPLLQAPDFLEPPTAPGNYKDPDKIAAYIADATANQLSKCALDVHLARITAAAYQQPGKRITVRLLKTARAEKRFLREFVSEIMPGARLLSYNGRGFDWPLLTFRCLYYRLPAPEIPGHRYNLDALDLCDILSSFGVLSLRSLGFFIHRLGLDDAKPLDGAEEARVFETQRWADLKASVRYDVRNLVKLARWRGVIDG